MIQQQATCADKNNHSLVGAIDQGTSSTRFLVFESDSDKLVASSQIEVKRIVPKEGWVEMDPKIIMKTVYDTIADVHNQLGDSLKQLECIGICNQRESTVVWDRISGEPLYNVIVWLDNRTKDIVDEMIDSTPGRDFNFLKDKTGLPMSTYFSAFKLKWLIDNVPAVRQALIEKRLLFGTVDTWILWNLTAGSSHLTDVTNASRTFLMNIETLEWDLSLCKLFGVPTSILPTIKASADDFGTISCGPLSGLPITGVIGDQSAALFGHNCLQLGQTKATFGTGCFIMQNIGTGPLGGALTGVSRDARRGLVTTVAYKLRDKPASYALEGSIKIAGAALTWLRDNLQLISDYSECDVLIDKTTHSAGVFFVPALGGLYSPYWDPNASGLFIGLSQFSRREHLVRATFDSIAYQTNDILNLMRGVTSGLMIDGGLVKSDNMCQILADITGCEIVRPSMSETSALGAAMVAGHGAGIWSYDSMLERSNSPMFGSNSLNSQQTHHYPPKALHYEEKFSSILNTSDATESVCRFQDTTSLSSSLQNEEDNHRVVATDNTRTSSALSSNSSLENENDIDDDELVSYNRFSNVNHDSNTRTLTQNETNSNTGVNNINSTHEHQCFYKTPSSGYSSGDSYEAASNDIRIDTPTQQTQQHQQQQSISQPSVATFNDKLNNPTKQTINSNSESYLQNQHESCAIANDNQIIDNSDDNAFISLSTSLAYNVQTQDCIRQQQQQQTNKQQCNNNNSRVVDVFQSYISLEHRTELVNTWMLAVERSMKWTKVDHEEVRKDDYQRLSALPLTIYIFLSVGMFALSSSLMAK